MPLKITLENLEDYRPYLRALAKTWTRGMGHTVSAEDLVQETYVELVNSLQNGHYRNDSNPKGWIATVMRNVLSDFKEKRVAQKRDRQSIPISSKMLEFFLDTAEHHEDSVEKREEFIRIKNTMHALLQKGKITDLQHRALQHFSNGYGFAEMARDFGGNEDLWRMRFNGATAIVRKELTRKQPLHPTTPKPRRPLRGQARNEPPRRRP